MIGHACGAGLVVNPPWMATSPFSRTSAVKAWAASKSVDMPGAPAFARSADHRALVEAMRDEERGGKPLPKFRNGQSVVVALDSARFPNAKKGATGKVVRMEDDSVRRPKQRFVVTIGGATMTLPETMLDEA